MQIHPSGFCGLEVSYAFGQTVSLTVTQNGIDVGSCPVGRICNKMFTLNPQYPTACEWTRTTATNQRATHPVVEPVLDAKRCPSSVGPLPLPEINTDTADQDGAICGNEQALYSIPAHFAVRVSGTFNDTVAIEIRQGGQLLYPRQGTDIEIIQVVDGSAGPVALALSYAGQTTGGCASIISPQLVFVALPIETDEEELEQGLEDFFMLVNEIESKQTQDEGTQTQDETAVGASKSTLIGSTVVVALILLLFTVFILLWRRAMRRREGREATAEEMAEDKALEATAANLAKAVVAAASAAANPASKDSSTAPVV